jgi:septal ring factor EnvC (AmiA/AmiB activator)
MKLPFRGDYRLTQTFGVNPEAYARFGLKGHNGLDHAVPTGTPLYAMISGTVIEAINDATGYGLYVKIENDKEGALVGHMKSFSVKAGDKVVEGETLIGYSNNTGNSSGPHTHTGYYPKPRDRANGYGGYIDFTNLLKGNMNQVTLDSATFEKLVTNSSRYDEFTKAGYTSPAEIQKQFDDYKKAIEDKNNLIDVLEVKADEIRKTLNSLITACAKALNTVQEVEQVKGALLLVEKQLDDLDDLQRNYGELQLHSAKQVEDLNVEIARLQEIIKQQGYLEGLTDYDFIRQILKDLVRRLKAFIK